MVRKSHHEVLNIPDLIDRYLDNDQEAFVKLANSCSKPVWFYISSKVTASDAEDLFQEYQIELALYLRHGKQTILTPNHLQRLAITIGKRTVASFYRSKGNGRNHVSLDHPSTAVDRRDPIDVHLTLEHAERAELTQRLLLHSGLTHAQREAVIFVFLLDQTKRKAAADLGISEKSLRERLNGAFRKFRDILNKERTIERSQYRSETSTAQIAARQG